MTATTSFGTWSRRIDTYSTGPEQDINNVMTGGGSEWCERMEKSGAVEKIRTEYRAAIDAVLPEGLSLCGNEFYGPAGGPVDWEDIQSQIQEIDLGEIIDRHDVDVDNA